jgi:hypothetical protein
MMRKMLSDLRFDNGGCSTMNLSHGDVHQDDGDLKDIDPDHFLDEVMPGDDHVEPNHHQEDDDPIIEQT